jgi:hypothetical protein
MSTVRFKTNSSVFAIAPHLYPKANKRSRRRVKHAPLATLSLISMSSTQDDSDPPLSDDSGVLRYAQRDAEEEEGRELQRRIRRDTHGEEVFRRASGKTDASDTSSSFCTFHQSHCIFGHRPLSDFYF